MQSGSIPADAGKGFGCFDHGGGNGSAKEIADQIQAAATADYGTAGPALVEEVLKAGIDEIIATARELLNKFRGRVVPPGADSQVLRAADRFGLIAVAGELAAALGVVPWPEGAAVSAAETCFRDWLAARGGIDPHEVIAGIAHVRRFIEANGDSRFHRIGDGEIDIRTIANRAGYTRGSGGSREWLVLPEIWKEICQGYDPRCGGMMMDAGFLAR
jgi:putative DNA primase/helicase